MEELLSRFDILRTEYIKLINDKDVLQEWGKPHLEALYATRIGVYQLERLQLQLQVKAIKRKLELVRSAIAKQLPIYEQFIEIQVATELADVMEQINAQGLEIEKGKMLLSHLETPQRSAEIRHLFRQFAKRLHPDVNPELTAEQQRLWHLAKEAYQCGDLEKLKALQLVYEKEMNSVDATLQSLNKEEILLRIEVLMEGIKLLNQQIEAIRNKFPFDMEDQIKDEEWVAEQVAEIKNELEKLRTLEGELMLEYQALIKGYGGTNPALN